jgi:hypothetical protein
MRCQFEWPSGDNFIAPHVCYEQKYHTTNHRCICGAEPGDGTDQRRSADAKEQRIISDDPR